MAVEELVVENRSDYALLGLLETIDLGRFDVAFVELSVYPHSLRAMRRRNPALRILNRSINAEFYHHLHGALARARELRDPAWPRGLVEAVRRLRMDIRSLRWADVVLSITQWETDHYWRYLGPRSKVRTLPYYLPGGYAGAPLRASGRQNRCCCMTSCTRNTLPYLIGALRSFVRCVEGLGGRCAEWEFAITGEIADGTCELPRRVRHVGLLDNPLDLLSQSRAMAVLSDCGFGFKTKILDAIVCGCYVLLPRKLFERLPPVLHPFCIVVDPQDAGSFARALELCQRPFPAQDPNRWLRDEAFRVLNEVIFAPGRAVPPADGAARLSSHDPHT
jgi:hypothetical protein